MKFQFSVEEDHEYKKALAVIRDYCESDTENTLLLSLINVRAMDRIRELGFEKNPVFCGEISQIAVISVSNVITEHKEAAENIPVEWLLNVSQIDSIKLEESSVKTF